jgi:hypothetical protein
MGRPYRLWDLFMLAPPSSATTGTTGWFWALWVLRGSCFMGVLGPSASGRATIAVAEQAAMTRDGRLPSGRVGCEYAAIAQALSRNYVTITKPLHRQREAVQQLR